MIKGDFTIRDTLTNLIPGFAYVPYFYLLVKEVLNLNIELLINNAIWGALIAIIFSYILGFSLRSYFPKFVKYYYKESSSTFVKYLLKIIIGSSKKRDLRKEFFDRNPHFKEDAFKKIKYKNFEDKDVEDRNELFYLAKAYVKNNATETNLYELERDLISFNLASKLISVFILGLLTIILVMLNKIIFGNSTISFLFLGLCALITIFFIRQNWKIFIRTFESYIKSVIKIMYQTKEK